MGLSLSLLLSTWKGIVTNRSFILTDNIETITVRSISFDGKDTEMTFRTLSFKKNDFETVLNSDESDKISIKDTTMSFENLEPDEIKRTFSFSDLVLNGNDAEMDLRTLSFKKNDTESVLKSDESDKISIEVSQTFKNLETEKSKLKTSVSYEDLVLDSTNLQSDISKSKIHNSVNAPKLIIPRLEPTIFFSPRPVSELDAAAVKLQKVYKSYRTRRNLADCAVVVEELWWKALDFAALKRSSVSFFNIEKQETAVSKWARARTRAAKVGKGLSKDEKAQKLALQHWLEAIDPRHRYGHNLHFYYDVWFKSESSQPFFYWLDVGDGKEVNHERCSRNDLQRNCIKYLGPVEREAYEVIVESGKLVYRQSGMLVETIEGSKWIFVLSTSRSLYVGQKKKGVFQHSSFLSGGATTAAGRLVAHNGVLEAIWPYSGHYLPTEENFKEFVSFLEDHFVDLTNVKRCATDDDYPSMKITEEPKSEVVEVTTTTVPSGVMEVAKDQEPSIPEVDSHEDKTKHNAENVEQPTFNFGKRLSCKWSSGVGPRIGCVRDYPTELQFRALEQVNLSPRVTPGTIRNNGPIPSPRPSPKIRLSPRLAYMGLPSPRVSN